MRSGRARLALALPVLVISGLLAGCGGNSAADATARIVAGLRLVPTRAMQFTPANETVDDQCRNTATKLGYPVPCPGLLPLGSYPTIVQAGPFAGQYQQAYIHPGFGSARDFSFSSIEWQDPSRPAHLVVVGSPTLLDVRRIIFMPLRPGPLDHVVVLGKEKLGSFQATWVSVPASSSTAFGGHLVIVWSTRDHTYALGFHGTGRRARSLDLAVWNSIRLVPPA